jgi:hypothetical protein
MLIWNPSGSKTLRVIVSTERMRDKVSLSGNIIKLLTSVSVTYTCKLIFTIKHAFRRYKMHSTCCYSPDTSLSLRNYSYF